MVPKVTSVPVASRAMPGMMTRGEFLPGRCPDDEHGETHRPLLADLPVDRDRHCASRVALYSSVGDDGDNVKTAPAKLAVFRIQTDGRLGFVQRYDMATGRKPIWWMGLLALQWTPQR